MTELYELAEKAWNDEIPDRENDPLFNINIPPVLVAKDLYFVSTFGNVSILDTNVGLVLIDCGVDYIGELLYNYILEYFNGKEIHSIIYTHGHKDHVGGSIFLKEKFPKLQVIGHENVRYRFDRYCQTCDYNLKINQKQFGLQPTSDSNLSYNNFVYPTLTYRSNMTLKIGEYVLELIHGKGETDDATWVWLPEQNAIATGDFIIWNSPNCGNPQKVQRYPEEWAKTLRKMQRYKVALLLPGHGPIINGESRVNQVLNDTALLLEIICEQTIKYMNMGYTKSQVLENVKIPKYLINKSYLKPNYDEPEFIVSTVWREKAGWWGGEVWDLKGFDFKAVSQNIVKLFPKKELFMRYVDTMIENKEYRPALFFVEVGLVMYQQDTEMLDLAEKIYNVMAQYDQNTSLMVRNQFNYKLYQIFEMKSKL